MKKLINNKKQSGLSATELTVALLVSGVVGLGALKVFNNTSHNSLRSEVEASILLAKQQIRTNLSCEKTFAEENLNGRSCGIKLLDKTGRELFPNKFNDLGVECDANSTDSDTNKNPFKSGYYTVDGKVDIALNKVKSDGSIIIWAKKQCRY